jgi:hypothetical protein
MKHGNLRVADLARWFARPDGTVRGWVKRHLNPSGSEMDVEHIHRLLDRLETLIQQKSGFPLRVGLSPAQRRERLMKVRSPCLVSPPHTSQD